MKRLGVTLIILLAHSGAMAQGKTQDCYCTDKSGSRVELGETICLSVDGNMFLAKCEMSLNVPMWRKQRDGCVISSTPQGDQPTLNAG